MNGQGPGGEHQIRPQSSSHLRRSVDIKDVCNIIICASQCTTGYFHIRTRFRNELIRGSRGGIKSLDILRSTGRYYIILVELIAAKKKRYFHCQVEWLSNVVPYRGNRSTAQKRS